MIFTIDVVVTFKDGVLDPVGTHLLAKMQANGFDAATVTTGKYFELRIEADSENDAHQKVDAMCTKLLANQYSEQHSIVSVKPG